MSQTPHSWLDFSLTHGWTLEPKSDWATLAELPEPDWVQCVGITQTSSHVSKKLLSRTLYLLPVGSMTSVGVLTFLNPFPLLSSTFVGWLSGPVNSVLALLSPGTSLGLSAVWHTLGHSRP